MANVRKRFASGRNGLLYAAFGATLQYTGGATAFSVGGHLGIGATTSPSYTNLAGNKCAFVASKWSSVLHVQVAKASRGNGGAHSSTTMVASVRVSLFLELLLHPGCDVVNSILSSLVSFSDGHPSLSGLQNGNLKDCRTSN